MSLKHFIWNVITAGKGRNADIEVLRRLLILNAIMIPGLFFALTLGVIAFKEGNTLLGTIDTLMCLVQLWLILLSRKTSNLEMPTNIAVSILLFFFIFLAAQGGMENTAIVWVFLFPSVSISLTGTRRGVLFSVVLFLAVLTVFFLQNESFIRGSYSIHFQIRFAAVYTTITLLAIIGEELRSRIQERLKKSNQEKEEAIQKLNKSLREIKTLQGILPICAHCKKIRDDKGYWQAVDQYIHTRTDVRFSHALCPECMIKHYSDYDEPKE